MGFKIPDAEYAEWVRKGLVKEDLPTPQATTHAKKGSAKLVEPLFVPPGTWVIPLRLDPIANGPAMKRGMIGRAGRDRRATSRELAKNLRPLAELVDWIGQGGAVQCRIVRLARGKMDDDNLGMVAKYVRDTVAMFLACGDGPNDPVVWSYGQESSSAYGVRIELKAMTSAQPRS